jgi:hypothetical protein
MQTLVRAQKKERFKIMSKKYSNALLEEEMKEDDRKSKSRSTIRAATNESTFKAPANHTTPTKKTSSGSNASSATKDTLNTSATSASQPQRKQFEEESMRSLMMKR